HQRRRDVVADRDRVSDAHAPRKLADDVLRRRVRGLEQSESRPQMARREVAPDARLGGNAVHRPDVVPVAGVLAQIPEPLLAVVEEVLVPAVLLALDDDRAVLEADDLVPVAAERADRA